MYDNFYIVTYVFKIPFGKNHRLAPFHYLGTKMACFKVPLKDAQSKNNVRVLC